MKEFSSISTRFYFDHVYTVQYICTVLRNPWTRGANQRHKNATPISDCHGKKVNQVISMLF